MQRLIEILFGIQRGFLTRRGDFSISFHPAWPWQHKVGAAPWNIVLVVLLGLLVFHVYRRDARTFRARITLGALRGALFIVLLTLLNQPVLELTQGRTEPSVLAVMIDDSISMRVPDMPGKTAAGAIPRLQAVQALLTDHDQHLLESLAQTHELRLYRFDSTATSIDAATTQPGDVKRAAAIAGIASTGSSTRIGVSLHAVMDELQGQRVAGIVLLTDGRETPPAPLSATLASVQEAGVKVFPIAIGSDRPLTNVALQTVSAQDSAFKGDIVNIRVQASLTGIAADQPVELTLKERESKRQVLDAAGKPVRAILHANGDKPVDAELQFKPSQAGELDLVVEAAAQPGEIDLDDNSRDVQISVLDSKINVLYVDGYPRWEYRYLKTEMIRDATIDISCLLTSADADFRQEGDRPITRFPETLAEMLDYDVILIGDVDPRQFTDAQLQLINDFVSKRGGGFAMAAGPRWSPNAYRGTPLEALLPVNIGRTQSVETGNLSEGFRPIVTQAGKASSIFRFLPNREDNDQLLADGLQPIYWYCKGITAKAGIAEILAEHPTANGPDGRKAPILVLGRFGAGRTLFSAIDDSWRWRFYTGESVFDVYWVQQFRTLARGRKLGQRRYTLASAQPVYQLGESARFTLRVLDPALLDQLPQTINLDLKDEHGALVQKLSLTRQENSPDTFSAATMTERAGKFFAGAEALVSGGASLAVPYAVESPRLELAQPEVDRATLNQIAVQTGGRMIEFVDAAQQLPAIPSAARVVPVETSQPLWDSPLSMLLFAGLLTVEWIARKSWGML